MFKQEIGKRIRQIREEKEMTREQLAESAEITTKFLYELENGKKGLSANTLLKIANALSCSCDYLLTGEGKKRDGRFDNLEQKQMKRLEKIVKLIDEFCEEN